MHQVEKPVVTKRRLTHSRIEAEVERFLNALYQVGEEIRRTRRLVELEHGPNLAQIFKSNACALVGEENVGSVQHRTGSTDMGDVSYLMPVLHPYVGGATGLGHGSDYVVRDYGLAVLTAAKALATTAVDLLAEGATQGRQVLANHQPEMSRDHYLKFMRSLAREELFDANS